MDNGTIESVCDDLRMALQDLLANGPDGEGELSVRLCLATVEEMLDYLLVLVP